MTDNTIPKALFIGPIRGQNMQYCTLRKMYFLIHTYRRRLEIRPLATYSYSRGLEIRPLATYWLPPLKIIILCVL